MDTFRNSAAVTHRICGYTRNTGARESKNAMAVLEIKGSEAESTNGLKAKGSRPNHFTWIKNFFCYKTLFFNLNLRLRSLAKWLVSEQICWYLSYLVATSHDNKLDWYYRFNTLHELAYICLLLVIVVWENPHWVFIIDRMSGQRLAFFDSEVYMLVLV